MPSKGRAVIDDLTRERLKNTRLSDSNNAAHTLLLDVMELIVQESAATPLTFLAEWNELQARMAAWIERGPYGVTP